MTSPREPAEGPASAAGEDTDAMPGSPAAPAPAPPLGDSVDDALPGTIVGEYQLEERIGEGGFGAVYRAHHPMIGKVAAVKVLSAAFSSHPVLSKRFVNEARVVNRINHRNIVDIFSFGRLPDGRLYLVMEFLDGQSLGAFLAHRVMLTVEEALPILRAVASAVDAAHEVGVVHRDLKPDNVFLARDREGATLVKLLDFGIAKVGADPGASTQTQPGQVLGTPSYMSPEQARGADIDGRSDVYSFGALIHRLLTGKSVFFGRGSVDVALAHISEAPPRMSAVTAAVPAALDGPVLHALEKKPDARPQTLSAVVDELFAAAVSVGLVPESTPPRLDHIPPHRGGGGAQSLAAGPPTVDDAAAGRAADTELDPLRPHPSLARASALPTAFESGSAAKRAPGSSPPVAPSAPPSSISAPGATSVPAPSSRSATGLHGQGVDGARSPAVVWLGLGLLLLAAAAMLVFGGRGANPGSDPLPSDGKTEARAATGSSMQASASPVPSARAIETPSASAANASVVQITIVSKGAFAEAFQGEAPLGPAGKPFPLPRGKSPVLLSVRAAGFASQDVVVVPDEDRTVEVALKRASLPASAPPVTTPPALPPPPVKTKGWDVPPDLEAPQ